MPRLVNDEYLVSIGSQPEFHSSMDFGLRMANTDMLNWLITEYKLSAPEANLLMGTVVRHKIGPTSELSRRWLRGNISPATDRVPGSGARCEPIPTPV